ncbi:hypothetical protein SAMN04487906_0585 [Zhouia amylolytica]|uniref:DinB family protein n=1 Tax=Zhouia amylolytica TaxID=376730 RepID=A0A1I6QD13_9FLAO|nr:hypothetical protein [Zhouia amylolytica]SFS50188.1 hypothetical protein SAMN04487906_0585 [Zhouia amylolytica]
MIIEATCQNLTKLKNQISLLSEDQYVKPMEVLNNSTIGMHVRHVLEFYQCLIASKNSKILNYDLRNRDISIETRIKVCLAQIETILQVVCEEKGDFQITLEADYCESEEKECISLQTTYFRELLYNIEHAVHHMAIIKIGMKALGIEGIDDNFGVAASTIRNQKICAQ